MRILWIVLGLLLALIVLVGLWAIGSYNRLVRLRERFRTAYAQIDVQLKRRYDLIPNLVEAVKGYMRHERDTLEAVIAARNQAVTANANAAAHPEDPQAIRQISGAESGLMAALEQLRIVQERYPELKADQQTARLMEELTSTENRIAFARQHYNDSVMTYNSVRQSFPAVLISTPLGFGDAALFEVNDPGQREAVQINLQPTANPALSGNALAEK